MRTVVGGAIGVGGLTMGARVFAQPPVQLPMGPFQRGWSPWGGGATGDWMTLWTVIFAVVFFILWSVERRGRLARGAGSALEILKSRYARGEVDRREFDEKRRDLL